MFGYARRFTIRLALWTLIAVVIDACVCEEDVDAEELGKCVLSGAGAVVAVEVVNALAG